MSEGSYWRRIMHNGQYLSFIGINPDGSLHNPKEYPEEQVRAAIAWAEANRAERRAKGRIKAVETRKRRWLAKIYKIANGINGGKKYGPSNECVCCEKNLTDSVSIERGVGPECWDHILRHLEAAKKDAEAKAAARGGGTAVGA